MNTFNMDHPQKIRITAHNIEHEFISIENWIVINFLRL